MIANENKHDTIKGPGFAAFIDLHDSTYAWDQNADIAVEMLKELYKLVESSTEKHEGIVGNFTGDGFLMLFTAIEKSILCLSRIIEKWELVRKKYIKKYSASGIMVPDEQFLSLRTGVSFGNFGPFKIKNTIHYAGSGINKAQRCESSSKDFFIQTNIGKLKFPDYVFIDSSAENLILSKSDFDISEQLEVKFKGYSQTNEVSGSVELESRKQFIYAMWPKKKSGLNNKSVDELEKIAFAQAQEDIGNRLLLAAQSIKSGLMLHKLSESAVGKNREKLLKETVKVYEDALQVYTFKLFPNDYARLQKELGKALCDQAELLAGENKNQKLKDALMAQTESLRVYDSVSFPREYIETKINLGSIFRNQAIILKSDAKLNKLDEAVNAYKEVLGIITLETFPKYYALSQNNIGNIYRNIAILLSGQKKRKKLDEASFAYREALRIYTFDSFPEDYGRTKSNLGNVLKSEGEGLAGKAKIKKIKEAIDAFKEALKVYDFDSSPFYYAGIQSNLGNVLKNEGENLVGKAKVKKIKEAISAYKAALKVYTFDSMPEYYAVVQLNLAIAMTIEADSFAGNKKRLKVKEVLKSYNESLRVFSLEYYPNRYQFVIKEISKLNSILKTIGVKK